MINEFLQYLQYEKNYSSHTVLSYHTDMTQFCNFLNVEETDFDSRHVEMTQIQQWVLSLIAAGVSARSVSRKISTLKSFWRFLLKRGVADKNPMLKIVLPKTNRPLPVFFKNSEMEKVFHSLSGHDYESVRDRLMIKCFYMTGVRISELISLTDTDIDLQSGYLKVTGKRNKQRIIPVSAELCSEMERYIVLRNEHVDREDFNLFLRSNGKKMYARLVYTMVHETMSAFSQVSKRSPHVLRHSFATGMLNGGADIDAVKELLGHSSLAATQVYTHTSFEELYNIYQKAHPRAIKKGGNYETTDSIHQL